MRQAKPERGGCRRLKLLVELSRSETCPAQASDQPVSSVAWNEGDLGCEAYTESVQAMVVQPRNHCSVVRADTVLLGGRRHRCADFARRRDLTGVRERGMHTRVPQEPGRSRRLHTNDRAGQPGKSVQASRRSATRLEERRSERTRGTAKRRQRSAAGWAAGSRSALIVPMKQGNSPRRTLGREAKRRPADLIEGNMLNTSRFHTMST